jgi:hypothetical protein
MQNIGAMSDERALVAPARSQLLDRAGLEAERSVAERAVRYVLGVSTGVLVATVAGVLSAWPVGALALLATIFGPPLAFLGRRTLRFVRAGFAATGAFRLAKHPVLTRFDGVGEGQWVRVRGHVLPGPGFVSAGGRPHTVLACYIGTLGRLRGSGLAARRWELHGVDFSLALEGGERVRVRVAGARYLGRPSVVPVEWFERRPLSVRNTDPQATEVASVYQEDVVAVGDEVEVLGFLRREVDTEAESAFRGARPALTLRARPPWALLIRRPLPPR